MTVFALLSDEVVLWQIALGVGLVVLVVVIACLTLLVLFVRDIDAGVAGTWDSATRLAANTSTTWQIDSAAASLRELRDEVARHGEEIERR